MEYKQRGRWGLVKEREGRLRALYGESEDAERCRGLEIAEGATFVSDLGHGDPESDVFFCGEAPGAEEDREGVPFVGSAGRRLEESLGLAGLSREGGWGGNVVRYRPTAAGGKRNRKPTSSEIEACLPLLLREIEIVDPRVVVTLGLTSFEALTGSRRRMGDVAGRPREWEGRVLFPMYHPAAALYNRSLEPRIRGDFRALRELLATQPSP